MNDKSKLLLPTPARAGFTLIELLVVIAIIAILAAMLLPALAAAKRRALLANCLSNQKEFALAWTMFGSDHADSIPSAGQTDNTSDSLYSWRIDPTYLPTFPAVQPGQSAQVVYDDYGFGQGALGQYTKNSDIIHCPADTRWSLGVVPAWCSYSVVDNNNGSAPASPDFRVHFIYQVKHPTDRIVVNEECDPRNETANGTTIWENLGTWEPYNGGAGAASPTSGFSSMETGSSGSVGWWDCPAAYHLTSSTFSFYDGHSESHKWVNANTLTLAAYGYNVQNPSPSKATLAQSQGTWNNCKDDLYWLYSHIATPYWP